MTIRKFEFTLLEVLYLVLPYLMAILSFVAFIMKDEVFSRIITSATGIGSLITGMLGSYYTYKSKEDAYNMQLDLKKQGDEINLLNDKLSWAHIDKDGNVTIESD